METAFSKKSMINRLEVLLHTWVKNKITGKPELINGINSFGGVNLGSSRVSINNESVTPLLMTPGYLRKFGFGVFPEDTDEFYHEPVKDSLEDNFWGYYNIKTGHLIISNRHGRFDRDGLFFVHEFQLGLVSMGLVLKSMSTVLDDSRSTLILKKSKNGNV